MNVPKPVVAGFVILAFALIGLNVALVKQDRKPGGLNKAYEANLHLNVGATVPPLSGASLTGSPATIEYESGQPMTLLLVFARSCSNCTLNWPAWQKLLAKIDPTRARVIGISLQNEGLTSQFLTQIGMTAIEMTLLPDASSILSYRFRYTPQTILVGSDRKVEGIWSGVLNTRQISEIQQAVLSPQPQSATNNEAAQ
ncbi:MAG TPA: redoxin domain-containing protein [Candidatus Acidoferrales bacterium]|nr:redoxin domain-containing protein [Candidatus Acidoferrales bacterium]